jgi:hypothetical protein
MNRTATAQLLAALEAITHEAANALAVIDSLPASHPDRAEIKRRVIELQSEAQDLFDRIATLRIEEPRN